MTRQRNRCARISILLLLLCALCAPLSATPVQINFGVPGGPFNDNNGGWFVRFISSGDPNLQILRVGILLGGPLVFDTVGPFSGAFVADPDGLNIGTPGLVSTTPNTVIDDSFFFIMNFGDFNVGEMFRWTIDVDATPNLLGVSLVTGPGFVDNLAVAVQVGGPGYDTQTLVSLVNFVDNVDRGPGAVPIWGRAVLTGDIALAPEPGTFALFGAALLCAGLSRRFTRR